MVFLDLICNSFLRKLTVFSWLKFLKYSYIGSKGKSNN